MAALTACSSKDDDSSNDRRPIERTVIVYIAAENNLSQFSTSNLTMMKEGTRGLGSENCLVVYVDRSTANELPWMARIRDGQVTDSVSLSDMGISSKDELSSNPHVLEDVLRYAVGRYPASRDYGLVLWGHCTGWLMADSVAYTRAYGIDNGINSQVSTEGKWLNMPTIARVLAKLPHLRFIFADCCNFMCLESLYELRNVADYIIGAPAEIPDVGAPYKTVVPALFMADGFVTEVAKRYYAQKVDGLDLPLTVVKTSELEQLATATRNVMQTLKGHFDGNYPELKGLIYYYNNYPKFFYNPDYNIHYDAGDFIRTFAADADYQQWKQALDRAVVYRTFSSHWKTNKAWTTFYGNNFSATEDKMHGVSMYVLQSPYAGNHMTYARELKRYAWYTAAGLNTIGW